MTDLEINQLEAEAKAQIPSTNAKKILILIAELRDWKSVAEAEYDHGEMLRERLASAEEALKFYAAGDEFIDISSSRETEFYDNSWHVLGVKAQAHFEKYGGKE